MLAGSAPVNLSDDFLDEKGAAYISVSELSAILLDAGLYLGQTEVELLAAGFASDGLGGINTLELCQTLFTLLYNVVKQHSGDGDDIGDISSAVNNRRRSRKGQGSDDELVLDGYFGAKRSSEEVDALMQELCDDILCYDK
jgi:hypothetical protein